MTVKEMGPAVATRRVFLFRNANDLAVTENGSGGSLRDRHFVVCLEIDEVADRRVVVPSRHVARVLDVEEMQQRAFDEERGEAGVGGLVVDQRLDGAALVRRQRTLAPVRQRVWRLPAAPALRPGAASAR